MQVELLFNWHRLSRAIRATGKKGGGDSAKGKDAGLQKGQPAPASKGNQLFAIQLVADSKENATILALIDGLKLAPILRQAKVLGYVNIVVTRRSAARDRRQW